MNVLAAALRAAEEEEHHYFTDDKGIITHSWIWPETYELIYGGVASLIIFAALAKFALPVMKKSMAARTARIQGELDGAANAKQAATVEAERIRAAKGDIAGERSRLLGDAEDQARTMLTEGRARLTADIADLEAKAAADVAQLGGRANDELRAEIAQRASAAADTLVVDGLDAATHQDLIEAFIAKVGAGR